MEPTSGANIVTFDKVARNNIELWFQIRFALQVCFYSLYLLHWNWEILLIVCTCWLLRAWLRSSRYLLVEGRRCKRIQRKVWGDDNKKWRWNQKPLIILLGDAIMLNGRQRTEPCGDKWQPIFQLDKAHNANDNSLHFALVECGEAKSSYIRLIL